MRTGWAWIGAALACGLATAPAAAADLREFCAERPGLDTPACIVDVGHVQVEAALADWTRETASGERTDRLLLGDVVTRWGIGSTTEARFGWTIYGRERERDRAAGTVATAHRPGDITLGLKQNLSNPDGSGLSIALLPTIALPVGRRPIGDGTWHASLLVPASYEIAPDVKLQLTPEADAAPDESGHGRHLAYGSTASIDVAVTEALDLDLEVQAMRGRDPSGHATTALASASLAYQIGENMQIDIGSVAGLNRASPDVQVYCGVARRF